MQPFHYLQAGWYWTWKRQSRKRRWPPFRSLIRCPGVPSSSSSVCIPRQNDQLVQCLVFPYPTASSSAPWWDFWFIHSLSPASSCGLAQMNLGSSSCSHNRSIRTVVLSKVGSQWHVAWSTPILTVASLSWSFPPPTGKQPFGLLYPSIFPAPTPWPCCLVFPIAISAACASSRAE